PVFVNYRSMTRKLQFRRHRLLTAHRNPLLHGNEILPLIAITVAISVCIRFVKIKIFVIDSENGESPRALSVMPDRNSRQNRFASADNVPAGSDEMDEIPQRWRLKQTMRIVRQDRFAGGCSSSRKRPIIAP